MTEMRKQFIAMALVVSGVLTMQAQDLRNKKDGHFQFTTIKNLERTDVDDQNRTSTCWSFSSLSFFESELLRMGKGKVNLSEMFVVRKSYEDKADIYVRMHGEHAFAPGGAFHDAINTWKKYGMMPQSAYAGMNYGEKKHNHQEMDEMLSGMVKTVVKAPNGHISTAWKNAFDGTLDAYLGVLPPTFEVDGKKYDPKSYSQSLGLNPDEYIMLTSFTHHPAYSKFVLEVPDNWAMGEVYNLPLNELAEVMQYAINNGYTFAWGSDVSDKGFSWKNGVAVVPENKWEDLTKTEIDSVVSWPTKQRIITPEMRQAAFDNYETEDDHGMHITGMAKDQNGTVYYIVKNSWGTKNNDCDGYMYASESYVLYKTTDIMLHKSALPKHIAKKLGL
jgi:bleomycin hydrolase